MKMDLIFATHNRHKVSEVQAMLPAGIHVRAPMLECLLAYYSRHVTTAVSGIQSHKVLKDVLR